MSYMARGLFVFALIVTATMGGAPALYGQQAGANQTENPRNNNQAEGDEVIIRTGIYEDRIVFGQSAAFSGPAKALGEGMRLGIEAAFSEANKRGGVAGRRLELISLDDSYEPSRAITNTRKLIEEENVFSLIGAVGTPTSRSAVPIAADNNVPYVAPFTGAGFLRDKALSNVINLRASYDQEVEVMVERLIKDLNIKRIGLLFQDDSFGRAGYDALLKALDRRNLKIVAEGVYPRNTTAIKTALLNLRAGKPEAVIMVGAYTPVATFVLWARRIDFNPIFLTLSFVGSNAFARALGSQGEGLVVTQVVPDPKSRSPAAAVAYRRALAAHAPKAAPGVVSFEGYLAGRLAIAALEGCKENLDRICFVNNLLLARDVDLEGFALRFGSGDNQGSDAVFLTVIDKNGGFRAVNSLKERVRG
ncbi:MAG: ABC transporter substrate-binding protein [Parvularculales bacterium]